ncbi:RraA family protein [Vibrio penaeicida]|uniref:RraA family protein n=1 Tax=Vibrio penaeicida TaxID=104609 RepID=UPI000CEA0AB8|nr:RraA family protein [Vibrio penaeicida]
MTSHISEQDEITELLKQCYTGVVNDVMRGEGITNYVLPRELRPLITDQVLAGPVFTIQGEVDQTMDGHQSLLEWTGLLSKAKPGHIWVCQPNDNKVAHMGELSAETLQHKGVLGCLVDGGARDTGFIRRIGFQLWHRFYTPEDIVGYWKPVGFDVAIEIGGVTISPGDYLLADDDGAIIIPKSIAKSVAEAAYASTKVENKVRSAILDGMDAQEAYLQYGKF